MPTIFIKPKNNSETVYFQSIMGTYSHAAWVRTEDPCSGVMHVIHTPDMTGEVMEIIAKLKTEIEFEEVIGDRQEVPGINAPDVDER